MKRLMRQGLAAALLMFASACSAPDYSPVMGWARTASLAADHPAALAVVPPPAAADQREGTLAMREALVTYLSALGRMADDGVLPFLENPFEELAPRAARADPAGGEAVAAMGALLRRASRGNWQAPELRDTIRAFDPPVQALVVALSGTIEGGAAPAAEPEPDPLAATRTEYVAVVTRIGEGHALLRERAGHITRDDVVQLVRAQEDQLHRAAFALPRPALPVPAAASP